MLPYITMPIQKSELPVTYKLSICQSQIIDSYSVQIGYLSLGGIDITIPKNSKNIIILKEGRISPIIKGLPQPHINYIEQEMGLYSLFTQEDIPSPPQPQFNDQHWYLHFDGTSSFEGNSESTFLY